MAVKWNTVQAGDVLWDVHRQKVGNTTISAEGNWPVKVISIDHAADFAIVSYNNRAPERRSRRRIETYRRSQPKGQIRI